MYKIYVMLTSYFIIFVTIIYNIIACFLTKSEENKKTYKVKEKLKRSDKNPKNRNG